MKTLFILMLISTTTIAFDNNGIDLDPDTEYSNSRSNPRPLIDPDTEYSNSRSNPRPLIDPDTEYSNSDSNSRPYATNQEKIEREQLIIEQERLDLERREARENGNLYRD